MANKNVSTLGFIRVPIVDNKGTASRDTVKWMQKIETKTNAALTVLGIDPEAPISGTGKTIGGTTQNLGEDGMLPTDALTGTVSPGQVGFTLDEVPDGTARFAVINGAGLKAVATVDAENLAIINFADAAHENKILDNIADGVTYQRFSRIASGQTSLSTGSISGGAALVSTDTFAAVLSTDTIVWNLASAPAAGYAAATAGSLYIMAYVTTGNVNFYVGNPTGSPIVAAAQKVNWQVIR